MDSFSNSTATHEYASYPDVGGWRYNFMLAASPRQNACREVQQEATIMCEFQQGSAARSVRLTRHTYLDASCQLVLAWKGVCRICAIVFVSVLSAIYLALSPIPEMTSVSLLASPIRFASRSSPTVCQGLRPAFSTTLPRSQLAVPLALPSVRRISGRSSVMTKAGDAPRTCFTSCIVISAHAEPSI